jgi:hypothetical protein
MFVGGARMNSDRLRLLPSDDLLEAWVRSDDAI